MVHTPTITDITSLVYNTDTRIEEHVHKYRNTQSQIRSIYSVLLPPEKPKTKQETQRTHSQGLSHFRKWCSSKGMTTSTKVTKMTIQSIVLEVLVILEVLYFFKRILISIPRKSPVKIAHLCKNVLAGQPLAVDFFFSLSQTFFFFLTVFSLFKYNNNTVSF